MGWFSNLFKKTNKKEKKVTTLTSTDILFKFIKFWPKLNTNMLHLSDKTYVMPTYNEMLNIILDSDIDNYIHTYYSNSPESGIFDCDDFSLLLHAEVIKKRYKDLMSGKIPKNRRFPFAFGQIWYADKKIGSHAINICITSDKGIVFIEPQRDKISPAVKDCQISFIRM